MRPHLGDNSEARPQVQAAWPLHLNFKLSAGSVGFPALSYDRCGFIREGSHKLIYHQRCVAKFKFNVDLFWTKILFFDPLAIPFLSYAQLCAHPISWLEI
jgi:hypothetical protein